MYPGLPLLSGIYSKDELQSVSHEGDDLEQRCSSVHELLHAVLHVASSAASSSASSASR